jgi:hypothetical protein
MISDKLKIAVFLSDKPGYKIAQEADLHPSTLSKILRGIEQVKPDDARVIAVAKVLGLSPEECFEKEGK